MRNTLYLFAVLLLSACERTPPTQYQHTIFTFGTLLEITLSNISEQLAESTFDQLDKDYQHYHNAWSPWQNSDLAKINNALSQGHSIIPSDDVLPLIQESITLSELSNGMFNPAIGHLINLWQFHKHEDPNIQPPNKSDIAELLKQNPKMSDLYFDGKTLSSNNASVQLNFGAFAKGYAIDLSFEKLKKLGIKNAIINAGGDLRASGTQGTRLWNIGIKHPRNGGIIASVEINDDESIFTSGDYERYYIYNNQRYHHILNPNTGYPTTGTTSVTIIHPNAAVADAAATAILVAGKKHWFKIAKKMGVSYVMLIEENETIHMNPKMAKRIKFKHASKHSIVLSKPL